MSFLELLLRPANRNLVEVVSKLPNLGIGAKVTRKSWLPYGDSYWEVTHVKPRKENCAKVRLEGPLALQILPQRRLTWPMHGVSRDKMHRTFYHSMR